MAPAESLVLGTAGHIDHGKTSLIRALTGVDTDRLPEEKARGITIDLGFAALDLADDLRVAIVDVPGHEKLVRTMVSGAAGIDLVILVVAADEGVMPQTREHVAICDLLGIETGLVAITKSDLADEEVVELAQEEIADLLEPTSLAGASMVAVSSETGDGIDRLREELGKLVRETRPRTPRFGPSRLSIDRAFAMKGFGTVVTGTLLGAALESGANVEIFPRGHKARVRGLQSHGEAQERVEPGARCAINLQGVEVADVSRGDVVGRSESIAPTQTLDVELLWLPSAPMGEGTVSIEFLSGTAERRARLAPIGAEVFEPGSKSFARIHIDGDPVPLVAGDRFIARGFARLEGSGATLGGGVILDIAPPHRRRSDPELARELAVLATGELRSGIRERVVRSGMTGALEKDLGLEVGVDKQVLRAELAALAEAGKIVDAGSGRWLSHDIVARMETRLLEVLDAYHAKEPLRPGMSRSTLRGRLPENVPSEAAELAIRRLEERGEVCVGGEYAWRHGFTPTLDAKSEAAVATIREQAAEAALEPPSIKDWAERLDLDVETFRDLMAYLERGGEVVRAPGDLFFASEAIEALKSRVAEHFANNEELDTQTYKDIIGTSRRTAMPLMELLDDLHVTRRMGDVRVARNA